MKVYNEQRPPRSERCDTIRDPKRRRRAVEILEFIPEQERWACIMAAVASSPFLRGEVPPKPPRTKPFRLNFDWLLASDGDVKNVTKILEGRYADHPASPLLTLVTPKTRESMPAFEHFVTRKPQGTDLA